MNRTTTGPGDLLDVLRVLLLLQAALFLVAAIEGLVFQAFFGPTALGSGALSLLVGGGLLVARARLGRLARRGRRLLVGFEGFVLTIAVLETALALVMAGQLLGLVPAITRGLLPIAIVVLVRRLGRTVAEPGVPGPAVHAGGAR